MLDRAEIARRLDARRTELARFGVHSLALFGSRASGRERVESDVDLLVDFAQPIDLFTFMELEEELQSWLGARVDLVPRDALKPLLRDRILREAVSVF
jgi:predicted nucleotidyltransferase